MQATQSIPSESSIWKTLPKDADSKEVSRLEAAAQRYIQYMEPAFNASRERGLCRIIANSLPVMVADGDPNEQRAWNHAIADRVGELAQERGFLSVVEEDRQTKFVLSPKSEEHALRAPQISTKDFVTDPSRLRFKLSFIDETSDADKFSAEVELWTEKSLTVIRDQVTSLAQRDDAYSVVAVDHLDLGLPATRFKGRATLDDIGFRTSLWSRLTETLTEEWKDRSDLAWKFDARQFYVAVAYFKDGSSAENRQVMIRTGYDHIDAVPKKMELARCLYCV